MVQEFLGISELQSFFSINILLIFNYSMTQAVNTRKISQEAFDFIKFGLKKY